MDSKELKDIVERLEKEVENLKALCSTTTATKDSELTDSELAKNILEDLPKKFLDNIDKSNIASIELQKLYHNNGQPKLYINASWIVVKLLNDKGETLKEDKFKYKKLSKFHKELNKRKIDKHHTSEDPDYNWLPYTVNLSLNPFSELE